MASVLALPALPAWAQQESVSVTFKNNTQGTVRVYWLNNNQEHLYKTLKPGESGAQPTYTTHVWIVRDASDHELNRVTVAANSHEILAAPSDNPAQAQKTTSLDKSIEGLPWSPGFNIGVGVDPVTGGLAGTPFTPPMVTSESKKTSRDTAMYISSEEDLNQEVEASVSGKYNIQPGMSANASASYLNKVSYSENSTTLILKHTISFGYEEAVNFEFTTEARKLMDADPAMSKFREAYGDYYVSAQEKGAQIVILYKLTASSAKELNEFKASIGVQADELMSAEGSTRFQREASKKNVKMSTDIFMEGYSGTPPGGPWDPDKLYEALDWFKANAQGIPVKFQLKHYVTLNPNFPTTIDVNPNVFVELRQLYDNVWEARALYGGLPQDYKDRLRVKYRALEDGVSAQGRKALARDLEARQALNQTSSALLAELRTLAARKDFYLRVKAAIKDEPGKGAAIGCRKEPWTYGFTSYDKDPVAVQIKSERQNYAEDWRVGWRENTFQLAPGKDDNKLIVGWQVISNWGGDHNGDWWRESANPILLSKVGLVHVKSEYDRGANWSVIWYYVDSKDYLFD
jgi:hypothetical protein